MSPELDPKILRSLQIPNREPREPGPPFGEAIELQRKLTAYIAHEKEPGHHQEVSRFLSRNAENFVDMLESPTVQANLEGLEGFPLGEAGFRMISYGIGLAEKDSGVPKPETIKKLRKVVGSQDISVVPMGTKTAYDTKFGLRMGPYDIDKDHVKDAVMKLRPDYWLLSDARLDYYNKVYLLDEITLKKPTETLDASTGKKRPLSEREQRMYDDKIRLSKQVLGWWQKRPTDKLITSVKISKGEYNNILLAAQRDAEARIKRNSELLNFR